MALYRVWAKATSYLYLDVEADSVDEALDIAEDTDGSAFIERVSDSDWEMLDDEVQKLS